MNIKNSINIYIPVNSIETQLLITKLFTPEEQAKSNYFSEYPKFKINFFDYFSINYIGFNTLNDLKGKIFKSNIFNAIGMIDSAEIINDEVIIKISYNNSNRILLNEIIYELDNGIINEGHSITILKRYSIKPISNYFKKYSLNNFERNKRSGNFRYKVINNQSRFHQKDILIIEDNKKTNKKSFYFYQKP